MRYVFYNTQSERYSFSDELPPNKQHFDIVDLEEKKVTSADTTIVPYALEVYTEPGAECEGPTPEHEPVSESE